MVYVGSSYVELDRWSDATGWNNAEWRVLAKSSQDITNNTSRIDFKLQKSVSDNTAWSYDNKSFRITGTGAKSDGHSASQTWNYGTVSDTSWVDVGGDTSDMYWSSVKHADDGTLSLTATASGDRVMGGTFSTNISITLPTIPRASVPTASPNPAVIGSSGKTVTINTNRKSSSFTHNITLTCGSWTATASGVGASTTFTIPYSVIAQFSATSKTATCSISCVTKNGGTTIGTKTASLTLQVDSSYDHAVIGTVTIQDTNARTSAITQDNSIYIANISTLEATIPLSVSGSYTELAQAVVTCGTKSQTYSLSGTSASLTFEFDKVNASSLSVVVKDKRGNQVTSTKTWTLIAYQPVTATATVSRPTATGSVGEGDLVGMAYTGTFGSTPNSLTIVVDFKKQGDADYDPNGTETYTKALSGTAYNQWTESLTFAYTLDYQYQYDIRFTVSDLFSTAVYTATLMQGLPILSWDETEVDVWGELHIHDRTDPTKFWSLSASPSVVNDTGTWSNSGDITKDYEISGNGLVFAMISVEASNTSDTGTVGTFVEVRTSSAYVRTLMMNQNRLSSAGTQSIRAGSMAVYYYDGTSNENRLRLYGSCTKNGTNTWYLSLVCIGCTVTAV